MRKKIIASILVTIMLLTNFAGFVEAASKYVRSGGSQVANVAKSITEEEYVEVDGDYSAKSLYTQPSNVSIYNYVNNTDYKNSLNRLQKTVLSEEVSEAPSKDDLSSDNDWSLFYRQRTSDDTDWLYYSFMLPAENCSVDNVATIVYKNGIEYQGNTYDVKLDIENITVKPSDDLGSTWAQENPVRLNVLKASRAHSEDNKYNASKYNQSTDPETDGIKYGVKPQLGGFITTSDFFDEAGNEPIITVDVKYTIMDSNGDPVKVSGVYGFTDIDLEQGIYIKDFTANSQNLYIYNETEPSRQEALDAVCYKNVGNDTYFYSSTSENLEGGNAFGLITEKDNLDMTFTWGTKKAYSSVIFEENAIKTYHKITTKVEGGTIDPSITKIKDGETKTINYKPDDGYELKSVIIDEGTGNEQIVTDNYPSSYTFKEITRDYTIHVIYEPKEVEKVNYQVQYWIRDNEDSKYTHLDNDENGQVEINTTKTVTYNSIIDSVYNYDKLELYKNDDKVTPDPDKITGLTQTITQPTVFILYFTKKQQQPEKITYTVQYKLQKEAGSSEYLLDDEFSKEVEKNATETIPSKEGTYNNYTYERLTKLVGETETQLDKTTGLTQTITEPTKFILYFDLKPTDPDPVYHKIDTSAKNGVITEPITNIPDGENRTIVYSPNDGYQLQSVTVDGTAVDIKTYPNSYTFTNIKKDYKIDVVYEKIPEEEPVYHKIDTEAVNGTITDPITNIPDGDDRTILYSPKEGYQLKSVTVDDEPQDITKFPHGLEFKDITKDHKVVVVYEKIPEEEPIYHKIDTKVTNGTITESMTNVPDGDSRTITYTPNDGYELKSVTVDDISVDITKYPNKYDFTNIKQDHKIEVVYEKIPEEPVYHKIDTKVTNGTITESITNIPDGEDRRIEFSPNDGYRLKSITIDDETIDISGNPTSYTFKEIVKDHKIEVVYEKIPEDIVYHKIDTKVTNGTITESMTNVPDGDSRTITYTPNDGYELKSVKVDDKDVDITKYPNNYEFKNVKEDHKIEVVYVKKEDPETYKITTQVTNGKITDSITKIPSGDKRTITYTPNDGYQIKSITVDGKPVTITDQNKNGYTFTDIKEDHTISVVYEKIPTTPSNPSTPTTNTITPKQDPQTTTTTSSPTTLPKTGEFNVFVFTGIIVLAGVGMYTGKKYFKLKKLK